MSSISLSLHPCYPLRVRIDCYIRGASRPDDAEPGLLRDLHGKGGRSPGGDDRRDIGDQALPDHL